MFGDRRRAVGISRPRGKKEKKKDERECEESQFIEKSAKKRHHVIENSDSS
jgi:hypothetical protein